MEKIYDREYERASSSVSAIDFQQDGEAQGLVQVPPAALVERAHRPVYDFVVSVASVIVATVMLVLLTPLMLLIALIIKLDSPGPVIFRQLRAARYGRPFIMYKFRTMDADAESRLYEVLDQNEEPTGKLLRITHDHRVTRVGQFLRRTSLDELPQLLNIIIGDMVFVGPRPLPYAEFLRYTPRECGRLLVTPGLTGLWQIKGRKDADFKTMVTLDLQYVRKRNLLLDLYIIIMTLPAMLSGKGAR